MKYLLTILTLSLASHTAFADTFRHGSVKALGCLNQPGEYAIGPNETIWSLREKAKGTHLWYGRVRITRELNGEKQTTEYSSQEIKDKKLEPKEYFESISVKAGDVVFFVEVQF